MVGVDRQSFRVIEGGGGSVAQDETVAEHVGAFLREARQTTGRSVAEVATSLRIRTKFVQSIEDGRYEDLPGQTYAVGFVRSYADYLGLDTEALITQFKTESRNAESHPDLAFPVPTTVGWFPTGKIVAICALLAVAVFAGWFFLQNEGAVDVAAVPAPPGFKPAVASVEKPANVSVAAAPAAPQVTAVASAATAQPEATEPAGQSPETPAVTAEVGEQPVQAPGPAADPQITEPMATEAAPEPVTEAAAPVVVAAVSAPAIPDPAPAGEVSEPPAPVETQPEPVTVAEAPPPPPAPPVAAPVVAADPPVATTTATQIAALPSIPEESSTAIVSGEGRTYGVINQEARVIIGAEADSWVQVLDEQQNVLLTRMLRAGDRYLVPDRRDLVMLTGNAGGLVISVDGDPVPKIGSDGAILHNVRLDVDLLKAGRAVIQ
ncbi:MAG: DUF4115 domain-containing protein [Alphaproteobacteria bacterium]|nr:DUF4115 domain-containing protein [Alphaproteobacteria bacterium]